MPSPLSPDRLSLALTKQANAPTTARRQTTERVEAVAEDGRLQIMGQWVPRVGAGFAEPGTSVLVFWEGASPVLAYSHEVQKATFPPSLGAVAPAIVEELFIAGEPGHKEIFFRNDAQITNLKLRATLLGDPVDVRWGADRRSFVVRVGGPPRVNFALAPSRSALGLPPDPLVPAPVPNVPQDQKYFTFAIVNKKADVGLGPTAPRVKQVGLPVQPSTSGLVLFRYSGQFRTTSARRYLKVFDDILADVHVEDTADALIETLATLAPQPVTLGDVLTHPNFESFAIPHGPAEVADFGLDRQRHLVLTVRARFIVAAEMSAAATGDSQVANAGSGTWDATPAPSPVAVAVTTPQGEGQVWVVDLAPSQDAPDGRVLFATTVADPVLAFTLPDAAAGIDGLQGIDHKPSVTTATTWGLRTPAQGPLTEGAPDFAGPTKRYPLPLAAPIEASLDTPAFEARNWRTLWADTRFPALITDGPLRQTASTIPATVVQDLYFYASYISGTPDLIIGSGGTSLRFVTTVPVAAGPVNLPKWTYYVQGVQAGPLPVSKQREVAGQGPGLPPWMFLSLYRVKGDLHEAGAFLLRLDGSLLATVIPWSPMTVYEVPEGPPPPLHAIPSEVSQNVYHDGTRVDLVTGNHEHVLVARSTAAERAAGQRTLALLQISTGLVRQVGTDWAEFEPHRFTILNLDAALYEAREFLAARGSVADNPDPKTRRPGRRFVVGWSAKTKTTPASAPTLTQGTDPTKYAPALFDLAPAGVLKALPTTPPLVPDTGSTRIQAVNDRRALTGPRYSARDSRRFTVDGAPPIDPK